MKKRSSFWDVLWQVLDVLKILIICLVGVACCIGFSKCSLDDPDDKITVPSWWPDRPDWVPDWVPSIFQKIEEEDIEIPVDSTGNDSSDDSQNQQETSVVTITFNANGGVLTGASTLETNENGTLDDFPSDPTYEGYIFGCWTITQYLVGQSSEGDAVTERHVFYEDTEIYALWLETPDDIPSGGNGDSNGEDDGNENGSGGEDDGNNSNSGGAGNETPVSPSMAIWTEQYQGIESDEQSDLPFEYCTGRDQLGRNGIKIRVPEGVIASDKTSELIIPEYIDGVQVLELSERSFAGDNGITSVTIEGAVIIGKYAFANCTSLEYLYLADGCRLNPQSFSGCTSLGSIELGRFAYVGDAVFYRSGFGTTHSVVFDFSSAMTLNDFLVKYEENEWEHMLGENHGAFYGLGQELPIHFVFSDCSVFYYSENEEEQTLLKILAEYNLI